MSTSCLEINDNLYQNKAPLNEEPKPLFVKELRVLKFLTCVYFCFHYKAIVGTKIKKFDPILLSIIFYVLTENQPLTPQYHLFI